MANWGQGNGASYEQGFERALATLADQFRRLTDQQLLDADDPAPAADRFVGLLLWIPINRALFRGDSAECSQEELDTGSLAPLGRR